MSVKFVGEGFGIQNDSFEKLALRYVHTSNTTIRVSALDLATGIFTTSTPFTVPVGTIVPCLISYDRFVPNQLYSEWNGNNEYHIEVASANTFYLVNSYSSNVRISYANTAQNQGVDITNLLFETDLSFITIDISKLKLGDNLRFVITGIRNRSDWSNVRLNGTSTSGSYSTSINVVDGREFMLFYADFTFKYYRESGIAITRGGFNASRTWTGGTSWGFVANVEPARSLDIVKNLKYDNIAIGGYMSNGSVFELYHW